jgi:hypothetical protein
MPLSLPLDAVQTRMKMQGTSWMQAFRSMQAEVGTDHPAGGGRKKTPFDVYFKALLPFVVLCLKPAIQNTIFERLKALVLGRRRAAAAAAAAAASAKGTTAAAGAAAVVFALSAAEAFFVGAIARAVATYFVFPYNRIKILLQTSKARSWLLRRAGACLPACLPAACPGHEAGRVVSASPIAVPSTVLDCGGGGSGGGGGGDGGGSGLDVGVRTRDVVAGW